MEPDRRQFVTGLAAAAVLPALPALPAIVPVPAVVESHASAWLRAWVERHRGEHFEALDFGGTETAATSK
jgi:hypothetical protein